MPSVRVFVLAIFSAAAGFSVAAMADGQDLDCTLQQEALTSYLDLRSPRIAKVVRTRRKGRGIEQTVRLASGTNVTFAVYGCAHLAYEFSCRPLAGVTKSTPLAALARTALEQLATVPILPSQRGSVTALQQALSSETAIAEASNAEGNGDGFYLIKLPDDFVNYTVSVPEAGVLQIEYDFPL
jgi:hypothetical protein